jgi:hypothetical protein
MTAALAASYVLHVLAGLAWVGSLAGGLVVTARGGDLTPAGLERGLDGLLQLTRVTGLILPATGLYQVWVLYPTARLFSTPRGWLIVAMITLWGLVNGLVELGAYRVRRADGAEMGLARHTLARLTISGNADTTHLAATARPYLWAAAAGGLLLLVDAGLLASGAV